MCIMHELCIMHMFAPGTVACGDLTTSVLARSFVSEPAFVRARKSVRPNVLVGLLAVTGTVVAMMQTLVVPLVASLPKIFHAPASDTSWIITITLLVGAVSTPVAGKLADMYGKKRMLLACLIPLIMGSVLCALATTVPVMVAGRGLQGMAMGIIPLGISMLHDLLPEDRRPAAISLMSSSLGIGGAIGLPFSAAVAQFASWRMLLWLIVAFAAVMFVLVAWLVPPPSRGIDRRRFDFVGAVGLGCGLIALLLPISRGAEWGWTSTLVVGLFAAAVVILLVWAWWELRASAPLVDLRATGKPVVLLTNLTSILVGFAMYSQMLIIPQLLQMPAATGYGQGLSMLAMGLWIAPGGLAMSIMSPVGARITKRFGPKITLAIGATVLAVAYATLALVMSSLAGLVIGAFVASCGVGLAYGAMPTLILGAVPAHEKASANGLNTLMRSIGTSTSSAVIGVVLANLTISVGGYQVPSATGFLVSFLIGCGVAALAAVLALVIPARKPTRRRVEGALPEESQLAAA